MFVMTRSFYGQENPDLTDELLVEAPAIFNWALTGLDRLTERGYFVSPESGQEAVQQLEDLSSPIGAFIRDGCLVGASHMVEVDTLWTRWKGWCEGDNRHPGTKAIFGRDLRAAVPTVHRGQRREGDRRIPVYQGLGVREHTNVALRATRARRPSEPNRHGWHRCQTTVFPTARGCRRRGDFPLHGVAGEHWGGPRTTGTRRRGRPTQVPPKPRGVGRPGLRRTRCQRG